MKLAELLKRVNKDYGKPASVTVRFKRMAA